MRWSQIKTLFILSFLILNIYLFIELYDKQKRTDSVVERVESQSTFEEQLKEENIILPELPEEQEDEKEPFITVDPKEYSDEEIADFEKIKNQSVAVLDRKLILSILDDPVRIPTEASKETITELVKESVPNLDQYTYWDWNHDANIIVFFQEKMNRPIYYNQNGLVLVFVNEDNEIISYSQSMLGKEEARPEKRTLISPIKAIETLYNSRDLFFGDEVNDIEVGFHTRIPSTDGAQVFVPTWEVTINETKTYFVNAIEGFPFSSNELEFLEETLTVDLERVQSYMENNEQLKSKIIDEYKEKLELIE